MSFTRKLILSSILFACIHSAQAGLVILGTRFIYPAEQKSIQVHLRNEGAFPSLAQSWIDDGQADSNNNQPDNLRHIPFVITPPVSRINPQTEQTLRIRYTGQELPQDRESIFYLNIKDVPPKPKADDNINNYLQFTFTSRLKLFFRPTKLPYPVEEAYAKVSWHAEGKRIRAKNNTPYYITYASVSIKQQDKQHFSEQTAMIAPFSEHSFTLPVNVSGSNQVYWRIINDYGGHYESVSPLQP